MLEDAVDEACVAEALRRVGSAALASIANELFGLSPRNGLRIDDASELILRRTGEDRERV